jgi:glyoxylase-like metal-dependent hydrolase (beta-lactamase superfamily II)
VFADTTFPDVWRHEFPDEIVRAQYHGPAHTSGDAVVVFEKANVVHLGDLVFNHMHPVIDRPAGGTVRGWISVLEDAAKTYPADAIYVFGHGSPKFGVTGTRADLLVQRDYWSALLDFVQKQIAAGASREATMAAQTIPGIGSMDPLSRLASNLATAYDELTEKKM